MKMLAKGCNNRLTDCFDTKGALRFLLSILSPKAEPFKIWLAQAWSKRINEIADPEKIIFHGTGFYRVKGDKDDWINQGFQMMERRKSHRRIERAQLKEGIEYAKTHRRMERARCKREYWICNTHRLNDEREGRCDR